MRHWLLPLSCTLVLVACQSSNNSANTLTLPHTVSLQGGVPAILNTEPPISLRIAQVQDSRCPLNTNCIWMGHATVSLTLQQNDVRETLNVGTAAPADMNLPGDALWNGYRLRLKKLEPAPQAARAYKLTDYRAEIELSKP